MILSRFSDKGYRGKRKLKIEISGVPDGASLGSYVNSQFTASDFAGKVASTVGGVTTYTYTLDEDENSDGVYSGINLTDLVIKPSLNFSGDFIIFYVRAKYL